MSASPAEYGPMNQVKMEQRGMGQSDSRARAQTVEEKSHDQRVQAAFDELMEEFRPAWEKLASI